MADDIPKAFEEDFTCHNCSEICTDPVQLPCQHRFCGGCLRAYISAGTVPDDKDATLTSKQTTDTTEGYGRDPSTEGCGRDPSTEGYGPDPSTMVSCPICRKPVEIDLESVSRSAVHFTLANIVGKYHTQEKTDVSLKCSMCEGGQPNTAVKGCITCRCLFCDNCLETLHPMRGPLSEHSLVEVWDYVLIPMCTEHKKPLKVFCGDCKNVFCLMCTYKKHNGHDLKDPDSVFSEEKGRLSARTSHMRKVQEDIERCVVELASVEDNIRNRFDGRVAAVEAKYRDTLKALENWKFGRLEAIKEKQDSLVRQTNIEMKRLEAHIDDLVSCLNCATILERQTNSIKFLRVYAAMFRRMDELSHSTDDILHIFKTCKHEIEGSKDIREYCGELLYLMDQKGEEAVEFRVVHQPIQCPGFLMKEILDDSVGVQDNGKVLIKIRPSGNPAIIRGALVDQSFKSGRVYWETDVNFIVKAELPENNRVYSAGVLQKSSKPPPAYLGKDGHSWGLTIEQKSPRCIICWHNKTRSSVLPVYPDRRVKVATVRQGFYLDCVNGTLTLLDCTYDRVLHTFRGIDVSEPLTPALAVYNPDSVDVSVRLRTGQDITSLPPCLYKMLQRI